MLKRPMGGPAFHAYELRRAARLIAEHGAAGPVQQRACADVAALARLALAGAEPTRVRSVRLDVEVSDAACPD
jgi:hypothetical protein